MGLKMVDARDVRLESRFDDMDYVDGEVGRIMSDLSNCLEENPQKLDILYLISQKHCTAYGQTILTHQLNGTGIKVETSSDKKISKIKGICAYDLDERKWIIYP